MSNDMYNKLEELVNDNKNKMINTEADIKVVSVEDLFLLFEDKSKYSIDDTDIILPSIKKSMIKLFGVFNNILVTEVYPEGIPKSVTEALSSKIYKLSNIKKDKLKEIDIKLKEVKRKLQSEQSKILNKNDHVAGEFDGVIQPLLQEVTILELQQSSLSKELQFLSMFKTKMSSKDPTVMGQVLHTKVILALLHTIKKIEKEKLTLEQVIEQGLLGEEKEQVEILYNYIQNLLSSDLLTESESVYNESIFEYIEMDLESHKNEAAMFMVVATNIIHTLVEMFDIELIKPPIMNEFESEELVPEERKEEWKIAVKFVNNQAITYIKEIIDGRYPKYKLEDTKLSNKIGDTDIANLKQLISFAEMWSNMEMLTELEELRSKLELNKKSIYNKYNNMIKNISELVFEEKDNTRYKRILDLVIYSTTKAEGIYILLLLL